MYTSFFLLVYHNITLSCRLEVLKNLYLTLVIST